MAAANKPIWVQVAEAGFGARLEELGWKPVSPAHWRLDGDGVIWRTLLDRAPKDILEEKVREDARPNRPEEGALDRLMASCFADETGFELAGLDDLIKRLDPDDRHRWFYPMIRKSVRVHMATSIGSAYYDRSRQRIEKWKEENPPRKASLWERIWYLSGPEIWSGPWLPMERLYDVEPAYRTTQEHLEATGFVRGWWDTAELGVEEVSARLASHWEELVRPEVGQWMTARDALGIGSFTEEDPDTNRCELLDVYVHYIAGDLDYCRRRLRAVVNKKVPTVEEKLEWLRKVKFFKKTRYRRYTEEDKRKTAIQLVQTAEWVALSTKRVAEALDLKLD